MLQNSYCGQQDGPDEMPRVYKYGGSHGQETSITDNQDGLGLDKTPIVGN